MALGISDLQFFSKTTVLRILQEATSVARAQLKDLLSNISNAMLHSDGTTTYGKQYHLMLIAQDGKIHLLEVKLVENGCATTMIQALLSSLSNITMYVLIPLQNKVLRNLYNRNKEHVCRNVTNIKNLMFDRGSNQSKFDTSSRNSEILCCKSLI